ncbi:MAG: C10 family peptidase [Bacteroidetes bacterium]|nr:C10 family peptidase [Bacteroidota bacterium]
MKKRLLTLLLLAFTGSLFAANVPLEQAKTYAINAYYQKLNLHHQNVAPADVQIEQVFDIKRNGESTLYIFNIEDYGYIILSADDVVNPIIAYSFESQYDPNRINDNFTPWIEGRSGAVEYARTSGIIADETVQAKWEEIKEIHHFSAPEGGKAVEPLLTNTWNQDWPYNYYMPLDPAGPGGRCYVGCVATAMSMIMHYWRYPEVGDHSKTHSYGGYPSITVNYAETSYDWDGMLDNSDIKVNLPTALIGMHAAVAVSMHWGPYGSGAQSTSVPFALSYYFRYDSDAEYLDKQGIAISTWNNYIQSQLDDNCPVYYSGFDGAGTNVSGHAFVLDGYHTDGTYHFNFGWSGYGNGWFDITDPAGYEWYYGQGMVRNIYPSDPAYPYGCQPDYERTTLVGSFEDGSGPQESYDGNASCSWLINPQTEQDSVKYIKLNFAYLDTDPDDVISIYDGATMDAELLGTYSGTTTPTATIMSTSNKVLVVFEADGDGTTGSGWKMEYESMLPTYCSGMDLHTAPAGSFDDGSGSFNYKNNTNCMYKIQPDYANGVTMTFTEFDTEEGVDILKVYDASNNQLIEELSGSDLPDPIFMESGQIFLVFQSDGAMNHGGFTVEYEADNVGIDEADAFKGLQVYPNPASNKLNITFIQNEVSSYTVKLISVTGEVVYSERNDRFEGTYVNSIDLSQMAKGVYFLNLSNELGNVNEKVIVK